MVTIIGVAERTSKNGVYKVIVLQGKISVAISKTTGRPYLTARKTAIPFTFTDDYAESLIGAQLPGDIERIECEEYEFTVPGTKKKVKLSHRFEYNANPLVLDEVVG